MCYFLYKFTAFDLVNKLVFVNDHSIDGSDRVCQSWCDLFGTGEVITVNGGNTTRATYEGLEYLDSSPADYIVKLDNDYIVSEDWLKTSINCIATYNFDVLGFKASKSAVWGGNKDRTAVEGHPGGIFIAKTSVLNKYRYTVDESEVENNLYTGYSYSDMFYENRDKLRVGIMNPALPMFSLDRQSFKDWDVTEFMVERGLDPYRMAKLSRKYQDQGFSRISVSEDRIKPKKVKILGRLNEN